MFNLRFKDSCRRKKYKLISETTGMKIGVITYSEKDIIKEIVFLPMISTIIVSMLFDSIFFGVVFGIVHLLLVLYSVLEKVDVKK